MDTGAWIQTAVAAYGAIVATAVAGYQFASRRRRLFLLARVDLRELNESDRADWKELDGTFPVLAATVVNTGARPLELLDVGLVLRPRGRHRIEIGKVVHLANADRPFARSRRLMVRRDKRLFVPMVEESAATRTLPRFLSDGQSADALWSLVAPPFKSHEPRAVFVVDTTGKEHTLRISRRVRREANRRVGSILVRQGPAVGGAIVESAPREVDEGGWAIISDRPSARTGAVVFDQQRAEKRLLRATAFHAAARKLREWGLDLSQPTPIAAYLAVASEPRADALALALRKRSDMDAMHIAWWPNDAGDRWIVRVRGPIDVDEPAVASFIECLEEIAEKYDGSLAQVTLASEDELADVPREQRLRLEDPRDT